jgi:NAD(P)-dependent dehydrogenase (short-subunit alcohol dehydrogenase family)
MPEQRSDLDIHPRKALVTGATAGIGRAVHVALGHDQLGFVAQRVGQGLTPRAGWQGRVPPRRRRHRGRRPLPGRRHRQDLRQARRSRHNAGYTGSPGPLTTQTAEAYDTVFNTNVRGLLFSLKHELRVMIEQGHGSIVNLSSTFGERGGRGAGLYVASKHAVNGFTRSALGDGRVLSSVGARCCG